MILIDNYVMDLVLGYNKIREAERELPGKWRARLLLAYAQRRQANHADRAAFQPPQHPLQSDLKARLLGRYCLPGAGVWQVSCRLTDAQGIQAKATLSSHCSNWTCLLPLSFTACASGRATTWM